MYFRQVQHCGVLNPTARLPVSRSQPDLQGIGVEKVVSASQVMRESAFAINSHYKFNRLSAGFLDLSGPCPFWREQRQQSALQFATVTQLRKYEARFARDRLGGIEVSRRTMELQPCAILPILSPMDQI